jgi:hypothetical protein
MKQKIWEGSFDGKLTSLVIEDDTIKFEQLNEGIISNIGKGLMRFASAHPFLTGVLAYSAYDAIKRNISSVVSRTKIYAKDINERSKMREVVKQMEKAGWKVVKSKYIGQGYEWTLERK